MFGIVINKRRLLQIATAAASAFSAFVTVLRHGLIADLSKEMDVPEEQPASASG